MPKGDRLVAKIDMNGHFNKMLEYLRHNGVCVDEAGQVSCGVIPQSMQIFYENIFAAIGLKIVEIEDDDK